MIGMIGQVNFPFLSVLTSNSPRIDCPAHCLRSQPQAGPSGHADPVSGATICGELAMADEMWYQAAFERGIAGLGARIYATGRLAAP
jgi:hypothetical protein